MVFEPKDKLINKGLFGIFFRYLLPMKEREKKKKKKKMMRDEYVFVYK
jgi:hypothetical protein